MRTHVIYTAGIVLIALTAFQMGKTASRAAAARLLIEAAARAEGLAGGNQIRHAAIGGITRVQVYPDHIEVDGTHGERKWFP